MAEKILFNIAIVGTGNLSWHLARAIASSEHSLQQVLSRNKTRAVEFAKQVSAEGIGDIDELSANIDIVILAVQDSVLTAKYI
ncbi:MAG: NAD(P)-binding domain-containing protein, partial [Bacteroidales bacterium]|nr:NAD(P)-binding domain-containing protein [Bacteroidales bacterium]